MSSDHQDSHFSPGFRQENNPGFDPALTLNLLAALRLNSTSLDCGNHRPAAMDQSSKCGSNKRQSPSSLCPQPPSSKRAALQYPAFSSNSSGDQLFHGFTKIPLSSPVLGRTLSAPIPSLGTKNLTDQSSNGAVADSLVNTHLPEESSGVNSVPVATPSQHLYRSFSEPIPDCYRVVETTTPPRPPTAGKVMRRPQASSGETAGLSLKQESPDAKRLKRMEARLREMNKWWNGSVKGGEEDACSVDNNHSLPKDDSEASQVSETEKASQEAVWVERNGELLILHFKCPCGKGYQILLSGNNCYYKLTSF